MAQTDQTGHTAAGQSSRAPADARVVPHSRTLSEPQLIVVDESEEELVESEQESSEPGADQTNRVGLHAAAQSSPGPGEAGAVHPPLFSEPLRNPRQGQGERGSAAVALGRETGTRSLRMNATPNEVARGRETGTRSLRMNATPNEETHNF